MAKTITMPDFMTDEEMEALLSGKATQSEPVQSVPDFISDDEMMALERPEPQKGLIERGLDYAGKTIAGAFQHPIETVKGIGYGAAKSIAGMATDFAANVNPDDNEDINMTMPGRFPVRAVNPESSKEIMQRREGLAEQAVTPITENLTPQESRAAKIGELLVPASAAEIALGGPIGTLAGKAVKGVVKGVSEALPKTADKLESVSNRMQGSIVKINTPEAKKGASNDFYSKYDVYGDANSVQAQWSDKIKTDADILRSMIKEGAKDPESTVNIKNVIRSARKKIVSSDASRAEKLETIKAYNEVADELIQSYKGGDVDLLEAQKLKQYVGGKGDWLHFNGSIVKDPKMAVQSKAHNAIYDELKNTIENRGPEGIREVNKRLSEMIPMELAARKRMLVANRNNPIPLTDYIGGLAVAGSAAHGNLLPAAVMGVNMASKSGKVARGVNELSKKIRPKEPVPEGPKPITDKSRLLPYQMVQGPGDLAQPIPAETMVNGVRTVRTKMDIPVGAKIRNLGESGDPKFDYKEPAPKPVSPKALPAPMVGKGEVDVKPAIASRGARAREIDKRVAELGKVENLKGDAKLTTFEELKTRHKDPFNYGDPDAKAKPATEPHIYSDDPRVKDLLTPAQYKKLVKDEGRRVAANKDMLSDVETGNLDEALTPDQFKKKSLMEYENHMNDLNKPKSMPEAEKASLVSYLVKKLGVGGNKVVFKDLSTDKKQVVLDLVNRLNSNKQAWNEFYDKGILDKPYVQGESNIHQDDIVDMINSFNNTKAKKSLKDIRTK